MVIAVAADALAPTDAISSHSADSTVRYDYFKGSVISMIPSNAYQVPLFKPTNRISHDLLAQ